MIAARSLRTMIRWIPVCGPAPRRYLVSGLPSGCRITKASAVGRPGLIAPVGRKSASRSTPALGIMIVLGPEPDPEQPAMTRAVAIGAATAASRAGRTTIGALRIARAPLGAAR